MSVGFRCREISFINGPSHEGSEEKDILEEFVREAAVQGAIEDLEQLLAPEERRTVSCRTVIIEEALPRNVVFELEGPQLSLMRIRDQVAPHFSLKRANPGDSIEYSLQVPMSDVIAFSRRSPVKSHRVSGCFSNLRSEQLSSLGVLSTSSPRHCDVELVAVQNNQGVN